MSVPRCSALSHNRGYKVWFVLHRPLLHQSLRVSAIDTGCHVQYSAWATTPSASRNGGSLRQFVPPSRCYATKLHGVKIHNVSVWITLATTRISPWRFVNGGGNLLLQLCMSQTEFRIVRSTGRQAVQFGKHEPNWLQRAECWADKNVDWLISGIGAEIWIWDFPNKM